MLIIRVVIIILGGVAFVVTTVVYIRIYLAVQRLRKNQIHVLQVQQATEDNGITNLANIVKSAFGIFYLFLLFLFCSLPFLYLSRCISDQRLKHSFEEGFPFFVFSPIS